MSILILVMLAYSLQVILLSPSFHGWENQDTEDTMNYPRVRDSSFFSIVSPESGSVAGTLDAP